MKNLSTTLFLLFYQTFSVCQSPTLLKNISLANMNSDISRATTWQNNLYFLANSTKHESNSAVENYDLWKSDGTESGTVRLKSLEQNQITSRANLLTPTNNNLFFTAGGWGWTQLWKSDGTANGTFNIKYGLNYIPYMIGGGNMLYFLHCATNGNLELWRSDGTESGTFSLMVVGNQCGYNIETFCIVGNYLYFGFSNGSTGQLWKTDGSPPTLVKTFSVTSFAPTNLTNVNGTIYFSVGYNSLWKSDGTENGTTIVKNNVNIEGTYSLNNFLYFSSPSGFIWKSDGTENGTVVIGNANKQIRFQEHLGNVLFYTDYFYRELGKIDLTTETTSKIKDISTNQNNYFYKKVFFKANNLLFFWADGDNGSRDMWQTDGTLANTIMSKNIPDAPVYDNGEPMGANTNQVFFTAYDDEHGFELWKTNGTAPQTTFLKDVNTNISPSNPSNFTNLGEYTYFVANDIKHGKQLWRTDGSSTNTELFHNFTPLPITNLPEAFNKSSHTWFGGIFIFKNNLYVGTDKILWKTDGTSKTVVVDNMYDYQPKYDFTVFEEFVLFSKYSTLWRTDGTTAGTFQIKSFTAKPSRLTKVGNTLYFTIDNAAGRSLWKSDGTELGTVIVKDFGFANLMNETLDKMNEALGKLFFTTDNGQKLWVSEGMETSTYILKDYLSSYAVGNERITFKNKVYFGAFQSGSGYELWESDGTITGTKLNHNIDNSDFNSSPANFVVADNFLYFYARKVLENSGMKLYKTDGNIASSVKVSDNGGFTPSTFPTSRGLFLYNSLYFQGYDDVNGVELWKTDGDNASTIRLTSYNSGYQEEVSGFFHNNGKLYFVAGDGLLGTELYVLPICKNNYNLTNEIVSVNEVKKYEVSENIISTSTIKVNSQVKFDAGKSILLNPGFKVENGSVFKARINGCVNPLD